jgi:hypothetical protein
MSKPEPNTPQASEGGEEVGEEHIPAMQLLLDNPFLLLFIGVAVPAVLYIIWGIMDIVQIPISS